MSVKKIVSLLVVGLLLINNTTCLGLLPLFKRDLANVRRIKESQGTNAATVQLLNNMNNLLLKFNCYLIRANLKTVDPNLHARLNQNLQEIITLVRAGDTDIFRVSRHTGFGQLLFGRFRFTYPAFMVPSIISITPNVGQPLIFVETLPHILIMFNYLVNNPLRGCVFKLFIRSIHESIIYTLQQLPENDGDVIQDEIIRDDNLTPELTSAEARPIDFQRENPNNEQIFAMALGIFVGIDAIIRCFVYKMNPNTSDIYDRISCR